MFDVGVCGLVFLFNRMSCKLRNRLILMSTFCTGWIRLVLKMISRLWTNPGRHCVHPLGPFYANCYAYVLLDMYKSRDSVYVL